MLIASADSSLRERLRHSLSGLRWQVLEASGGAAAAWEATQVQHLEALMIDPWLPDLEVHEFLKDFHRDYPNVDLMMTDGVAAEDSARSPYHQELLYALRRSQEVDTAAWNTAPTLEQSARQAQPSSLPPLAVHRSAAAAPLKAFQSLPPGGNHSGPSPNRSKPLDLYSGSTELAPGRMRGMVQEDLSEISASASIKAASHSSGSEPLDVVDSDLVLSFGDAPDAGLEPGSERFQAQTLPTQQLRAQQLQGLDRPSLDKRELDHPVLHRPHQIVEPIPELIGSSPVMLEVSRRIRLVASRTTPVLIEGPTGSGKEVVAEALHRLSKRARKPFVAINCAAIPEALLEAELFGHTRGAFTGAVQGRIGRIESADGGTLFLDEIGEMPLALQSKLLRFFESGELQRIGDNETIRVDVRIIAATHQPLAENAQKGSFRADLYYRLAVFLIHTPALAEHMNDLPQFVAHFLERMGRVSPIKRLDPSAMYRLASHSWPGNVRELEHVLERAAILAGDDPLITSSEIDFGLSLLN